MVALQRRCRRQRGTGSVRLARVTSGEGLGAVQMVGGGVSRRGVISVDAPLLEKKTCVGEVETVETMIERASNGIGRKKGILRLSW